MDFKTLKEAQDAHNELESSSSALLDESAEKIKSFESAEIESKQAVADAVDKIESLEGDVTKLEAEKAELAKSNAELEANKLEVQEEAAKLAAASGIDPLEIDGGESKDENTLSRADFDSKSQAEQIAFFKDGGKLTA